MLQKYYLTRNKATLREVGEFGFCLTLAVPDELTLTILGTPEQ
jgi:hypothetical protein